MNGITKFSFYTSWPFQLFSRQQAHTGKNMAQTIQQDIH